MSSLKAFSETFAPRRLRPILQRLAPLLLDRAAADLKLWASRQKVSQVYRTPPLILIVGATCFDDLSADTGFCQLLTLPVTEVMPIICLPTAAAVALFREKALREGFGGIIEVFAATKPEMVAASLSPQANICILSSNVLLTPSFFSALNDIFAGRKSFIQDQAGVYVGKVATVSQRASARLFHPVGYSLTALLSKPTDELLRTASELLRDWDSSLAQTRRKFPKVPHSPSSQARARIEDGSVTVEGSKFCRQAAIELAERGAGRIFYKRDLASLQSGEVLPVAPPITAVSRNVNRVVLSLRENGRPLPLSCFDFSVSPHAIQPWMITAYMNRGGGGNTVVRAFAEGTGCRLSYAEDAQLPCPGVPVVWGVLRGSREIVASAECLGQYFFYIDHAYFDRGHGRSYRITRNLFEAGAVRAVPHDRIEKLGIQTHPWRRGGREVIVCPPTAYFSTAHGCVDWLKDTLALLSQVTDRPLIVRDKPRSDEAAIPLREALSNAHALVTHSSNVAIEAAVLGIPVFVSPVSAAAPIGCTDFQRIESPPYPDRNAWLAHLAYSQFQIDEIRDGTAWRILQAKELLPFV